jgi:hypothetical protein
MMRRLFIASGGPLHHVQAASARWIAGALALTSLAWLVALAGLLAVANRVHDDVPALLAVKLPLLQSKPELIFGGESRTVYQVDAGLAAQLIGKPAGAAVNIAYDAGEPLALLAAMRRAPERFKDAQVVVSVAPFLFNEGVRSAAVYPQDVAVRLGVFQQMTSFLPLRVGTLIRFIREAFNARLAAEQHVADGPQPASFGLTVIPRNQRDDQWAAEIGSHPHYANWNLSGLMRMAADLGRPLVVALVSDAGRRCGFDVLNIPSVPGLEQGHYADEMHVNASGVPIYTRYLVSKLKR